MKDFSVLFLFLFFLGLVFCLPELVDNLCNFSFSFGPYVVVDKLNLKIVFRFCSAADLVQLQRALAVFFGEFSFLYFFFLICWVAEKNFVAQKKIEF